MFEFRFATPVVLYLRVSSDKQAESMTIKGQLDALVHYCERAGLVVAEIYIDEGFNGDLPWTQRPGACRLLADAAAGKVGTVLVYLYDRFSRNVYEGLTAARALKESGASPYSISEPFDPTTPYGEYMLINSLNNAQLWKSQFLLKTAQGSRTKARSGQWLGGKPPYGYRIEGYKHNARVVVNDSEEIIGVGMTPAGVIRWMYDQMGNETTTCYSLCAKMNALGIPTKYKLYGIEVSSSPTFSKDSDGNHRGKWSPSRVWRTLTNPAYKGIRQYGKRGKSKEVINSEYPRLVSDDVWNSTMDKIVNNQRYSRCSSDRNYLLRSLIVCAHCGRFYHGTTNDRAKADATDNAEGVLYSCRSVETRGAIYGADNQRRCIALSVHGSLEHSIWNDIMVWLRNPQEAARAIADRTAQTDDDADRIKDEMQQIDAAISGKAGERDAILTLHRRGRIGVDALDAQLNEIDGEEAALKSEKSKILQRMAAAGTVIQVASTVERILLDTAAQITAAGHDGERVEFAAKRRVVEALVEKITVFTSKPAKSWRTGETIITVTYRFGELREDIRTFV